MLPRHQVCVRHRRHRTVAPPVLQPHSWCSTPRNLLERFNCAYLHIGEVAS